MGWLDMPEHRYGDAATVLAAATHRPVRIVRLGEVDLVRVDLEFGRYVLAKSNGAGQGTDPDAAETWTVTAHLAGGAPDCVLAEATDEWLADAFDSVFESVGAATTPPCDGAVPLVSSVRDATPLTPDVMSPVPA